MHQVTKSCVDKRYIQSVRYTMNLMQQYENVIDSTLQPTFWKLSLVELLCIINEEYLKLSESC